MVLQVSDASSHRDVQIGNFADILKNAPARQKIFSAVYRGKKGSKPVKQIADATSFSPKRVTTIAKDLVRHNLFQQGRERVDGKIQTVYTKIEFIASNKNKILQLARNSAKLKKYRANTSPGSTVINAPRVTLRFPFRMTVKTRFITIDDVKEFSEVGAITTVPEELTPGRLPEEIIKKALIGLLGETKLPKDWGGETTDILTTRLTVFGRRRLTAFALKGPAKKGPLVPRMMGKNGDQIQRLFDTPAEVFFVQYEDEIHQSTIAMMEQFARLKALLGKEVLWGIIDRGDTYRLRLAYPDVFYP